MQPVNWRACQFKDDSNVTSRDAADFINGYVLDSVGTTGTNIGACATFLYNLRQACDDIKRGTSRVAVVGSAEALVNPEIMEGFRVMGALTQDDELCKLDNTDTPDNRGACRPFSTNAGFTIAEATQFMSDGIRVGNETGCHRVWLSRGCVY